MDTDLYTNTEWPEEEKLPRRDWILLPALSLITILLLVSSSELIAYLYFAEPETLCQNSIMPVIGMNNYGGIPNAVCRDKIRESRMTEYRLNSSGYRSNVNFGPKSPGTFRIVLIGSSYAVGARVDIDEAFATKLGPQLSQLTGKKIEILNMGMVGDNAYPCFVALRFKDALDAQPDMILQTLTPWDIQEESYVLTPDERNKLLQTRTHKNEDLITKLRYHRWRINFLIQHYLYEIQSLYVKVFLLRGVGNFSSGFIDSEYDTKWKNELLQFESRDASIEERVKSAGVPLVTTLIPIRAQAAMLSMGEWPSGYDPYKLDDELRTIITRHGGSYIDILPEYRNIPNPEREYFPIEGHLTSAGHATIARLLAKALTSGDIRALAVSDNEPRRKELGK